MNDWLLDVLACAQPGCGGDLGPMDDEPPGVPDAGLLRCLRCEATYPVLAGVPIVVPSPVRWMAGYRDSILASLAEVGRADLRAVAVVDAFAAASPGVEALRFGDDWVAGEGDGRLEVQPPPGGPATMAFARAFALAAETGPVRVLGDLLAGRPLGTALELGSGSGTLAPLLRARAERVVFADLSLRAVLRSLEHAADTGEAAFAGAVLDAEQLGLAAGGLDTLVAAHLVDLLDDPVAFLQAARHAIRPGGVLALSTPEPELGIPDGDAERLDRVVEEAGFAIHDVADGVPWLRPHRDRYVEVYFVRALLAETAQG